MAIGMPTKSKAKTRVKKDLLNGNTPRMTPDEKRLVREMVFERKMKPSQAATAMGRHISSITRLLAQKRAPNPVGRPKGMSEEQIAGRCVPRSVRFCITARASVLEISQLGTLTRGAGGLFFRISNISYRLSMSKLCLNVCLNSITISF